MKKRRISLLLCLFICLKPAITQAQKTVADSLAHILASQAASRDTTYLLIQCKLAAAQLAYNPLLTDSTARLALQLARQLKDPRQELFALNLLGIAAQRQDRYAEAATYYLPAIELAKATHDTARWARTLNNLGLAYFYDKDYPKALRSMKAALALQRHPTDQASLLNNMGLVYKNQEKPDSALACFHRALAVFIAQNDLRGLANAYSNIGQIHLGKSEFKAAERYYRQALEADQQGENRSGEAISTTNLGVALAKQKQYVRAVAYLRAGFRQSEQQHNLSNQQYAAENLYQVYENQARSDSALWWHKVFHHLQDSLSRTEQREKLAEISSRYAHDQQLQQAQQNLLTEQRLRLFWFGGAVVSACLLLLTLFAYWQVRQRRVAESKLREEETARFRAEQIMQQQRQGELQASLADQERVMASQSAHLLQKNEFIARVSGQLEEAVGEGNTAERLKPLLKLLKTNVQTDEQWEIFKRQFEGVHTGFFQRLLAHQPKLTAFDLRYCAYLRMNLTSKEIATLLNTSLRSVETQRYRLRQKLALTTEQDLVGWLVQI